MQNQIVLTKSLFLDGCNCPKQLWLSIHMPDEKAPPGEAALARMRSGQRIGQLAKALFPAGVTAQVVGGSNEDAAAKTAELIASGASVIFEATFIADGMLARVDVLIRDHDGWQVVEVKSSGRYKKEEHLADVAYQVYVLQCAGIKVTLASVMHLNKDYVWPGGVHDFGSLFARTDITDDVRNVLQQVEADVFEFLTLWTKTGYPSLTGDNSHVDPGIRPTCRSCSYNPHCFERAPKDHIFYLNLHHSRVKKLKDQGIVRIGDVPDGFVTDAKELLRFEAFRSGQPRIDPAIRGRLNAIQYPAHLIDFEAARPDVPVIPGTSPFDLIPFQWSCHTLASAPGAEIDTLGPDHNHSGYVHEDRSDPRESFARTLYEAIRDGGSILHYHAYEKTVIKDLAEHNVRYADELMGLIEPRFVDLEKVVAECYADARFGGLTSIKAVLPVVAGDLSYKVLSINDGDQAQAEYLRALDPACLDQDRKKVFDDLRAYCKLDTWAMVRLLRALSSMAA